VKKIIFFSPHTDDAELGAGGTITKFAEKYQVYIIAFSDTRNILNPNLPKDLLRKEMIAAVKILGVDKKNVKFFNFQTRRFYSVRQEILDLMIKIRDEIKPNIVFTPSTYDHHQDHQVITNEVLRAFKGSNSSILGYELPWNTFSFETTGYVILSKTHMDKKIRALKEYSSQSHRNYLNEEFIRGLAQVRGVQISEKYAEAFEVLRGVFE